MDDLFPTLDHVDLIPTRQAGLARLKAFTPQMGGHYARMRNHDLGPARRGNVSMLSPWIRTRTILEDEAAGAALGRFALSTAEKFIQEVCWRTYFKGWLEHRPSVWTTYLRERDRALDQLSGGREKAYRMAIAGQTGIEGFDDWARELVDTGYLHNHARMWFASIWTFTLGLPWELGADFFLTHLIDGDPASNTLSWRWVAGLHTPGKTYLARRSNMAKFTDGRFAPEGLATEAAPVEGPENPRPGDLRPGDPWPDGRLAMLLTEDDLNVETLRPAGATVTHLAGASLADLRSRGGAGGPARDFLAGAVDDALARGGALYSVAPTRLRDGLNFVEDATRWIRATGAETVVTGFPPVGWGRETLDTLRQRLDGEGVRLLYLQRDWDRAFWPHARKGFFGLKKEIPGVLAELGFAV